MTRIYNISWAVFQELVSVFQECYRVVKITNGTGIIGQVFHQKLISVLICHYIIFIKGLFAQPC